uniref:class I SAM-dependent methyltransferase n=1 Tax=Sphingomonas sp. TaxID=28214 RepID=UPI00286D1377
GVDIAANLVAAGNRRAEAAGLSNIKFEEGDASSLESIEDGKFDRVVSVFGAMFAPNPDKVASEMVRVTKPGGQIVMGNWIPGDPTLVAQILKTSAAFTPPPPEGFVSPMLWGQEDKVRERFAKAGIAGEALTVERDSFVFRHDGPPAELVDRFTQYYGPTMNALDAAEQSGRADELCRELGQLFEAQNQSGDPGRTEIPATFLRVTATKPD